MNTNHRKIRTLCGAGVVLLALSVLAGCENDQSSLPKCNSSLSDDTPCFGGAQGETTEQQYRVTQHIERGY